MPKYSIENRRFFVHYQGEALKLTPQHAATLADVSIKTVYKWLNGTQTPTPATIELMQIKAFGLILGLPDWRFMNGKLWNDSYKNGFPPHSLHIMAMLMQRQGVIDNNRIADADRIAALEHELQILRRQFIELQQVAPRDTTPDSPLFTAFERDSQGKRH